MKMRAQKLQRTNRIPISRGSLLLTGNTPALAAHSSTSLQIHHPKGHKALTSVLHFTIRKPKDARLVLTLHDDAQTETVTFPLAKPVSGNRFVKLRTLPHKTIGRVHHISIHAFAHKKNSKAKVHLKLKHIDISG